MKQETDSRDWLMHNKMNGLWFILSTVYAVTCQARITTEEK